MQCEAVNVAQRGSTAAMCSFFLERPRFPKYLCYNLAFFYLSSDCKLAQHHHMEAKRSIDKLFYGHRAYVEQRVNTMGIRHIVPRRKHSPCPLQRQISQCCMEK
jgi:hypothetical protein